MLFGFASQNTSTLRSALAVFGKVGVDQLMYTPIATGIFYATLDTLEGHPERLPQTLKVCNNDPA